MSWQLFQLLNCVAFRERIRVRVKLRVKVRVKVRVRDRDRDRARARARFRGTFSSCRNIYAIASTGLTNQTITSCTLYGLYIQGLL